MINDPGEVTSKKEESYEKLKSETGVNLKVLEVVEFNSGGRSVVCTSNPLVEVPLEGTG